MTDYQMDIFGNYVSVDEIRENESETIKSRFRRKYKYEKNHICKDCKNCVKFCNRSKNYYKCLLMGISASEATDIRLKDIACKRWEKEK